MTSMIATCPSCQTTFELDPAKVPIEGVRARCSICSAVIVVPPASIAMSSAVSSNLVGKVEKSGDTPVKTPVASVASSTEPQSMESVPSQQISFERNAPIADTRHIEVPRRKPLNPFLTRDPAIRAQRLARALVSDIVAYYPEKHAEALRDGTLKSTFREEIQKSFEEYVGQVGHDFAESTTYFQEALNDVLAGGNRQF